jgi:hypothetical protein
LQEELFFDDFSKAFTKLTELGCGKELNRNIVLNKDSLAPSSQWSTAQVCV